LTRATAAAQFHVALDVGANHGAWLMEAARYWHSCRFHAFEVAGPTFERLSDNVRKAGLVSKVTLNCMGLSDMRCDREIFYYPDHPDITSEWHRHTEKKVVRLPAIFLPGDDY